MIAGIEWLGHDTFRLTGSKTVYIDPWQIADGARQADLVLITHDHYDHLNAKDLDKVCAPTTVVVGPAAVTGQLKKRYTKTLAAGDSVVVEGVQVSALPAYNVDKYRAPGKLYHPREAGGLGFIVEMDGRRVYHAGDTDAIPEMARVEADVALVPVSGTFVMTAEEAAYACASMKVGVAVPMHYGSSVGEIGDAHRFADLCSVPVEILKVTRP
jgi:L-ascorbate metabolism protein UlaG (beta-lactamase superfamily)